VLVGTVSIKRDLSKTSFRGRNAHLEKRFLPRSQDFLGQAREPIAFRSRRVVDTVTNVVVVVVHVFEVKKLAIVFLEILVKLRILLSEFGQL
jgi:hypothetical protein